jgi:hypothetical protein
MGAESEVDGAAMGGGFLCHALNGGSDAVLGLGPYCIGEWGWCWERGLVNCARL